MSHSFIYWYKDLGKQLLISLFYFKHFFIIFEIKSLIFKMGENMIKCPKSNFAMQKLGVSK
jgi:hypothetical protein